MSKTSKQVRQLVGFVTPKSTPTSQRSAGLLGRLGFAEWTHDLEGVVFSPYGFDNFPFPGIVGPSEVYEVAFMFENRFRKEMVTKIGE